MVAAPISYTSNVALVPNHVEGDSLFTPSFAVLFVPKITGNLYASFSVLQQYFYYGRFTALDFGSFDAVPVSPTSSRAGTISTCTPSTTSIV